MQTKTAVVLLTTSLLLCLITSYRAIVANDQVDSVPKALQGTYLIYAGDVDFESPLAYTPIVDPQAVSIGGKSFLKGKLSGKIETLIRDDQLSGKDVYVAIDSIVKVQRMDGE